MDNQTWKAYIFYCSNNLDASQFSGLCQGDNGASIKTISLPCSGKVDIPYLVKAFEYGADGVAIVTCKKDECRHFEGNLRAHKRAEAVEALLEEIGMTTGRMAVFECGKQNIGSVLSEIEQFFNKVRTLPRMKAQNGTGK